MYSPNEKIKSIQIYGEEDVLHIEKWEFGVIVKTFDYKDDGMGDETFVARSLMFVHNENIDSFISAIKELRPKKKSRKTKKKGAK